MGECPPTPATPTIPTAVPARPARPNWQACRNASWPLAAGLLYPVLGLVLDPMIASMAMTMSSVSVIGNALRLGRVSL
jgi:hypothetical protein